MNRRRVTIAAVIGLVTLGRWRDDAMGAAMATPTAGETHEMRLTRQFDAPVERVWQAWTDGDLVQRWWGPAGFTAPVAEMDVRVGGRSLVCMQSPDGQDFYNTWTYTVIEPLQRLEFVAHFADAEGDRISPADAGLPPEIPEEVPHVITFAPMPGDRTELTVTEYGYRNEAITEMSRAGMNQCLDKMAELLG